MRKICFVLSLVTFSLVSGMLYGQARTPVPPQTNKGAYYGIHVMITKPAANENDDEIHQKYASKLGSNKDFTDWLFVDVKFPVLTPRQGDLWEYWVDDLAVRLEIIGFRREGNATKPVALSFTQPLNPVLADGKVHHVRFFVPPYVLYRYIVALTKNKSEMRKRVSQMYILATVLWRGNPICYITPTGRNARNRRSIIDNMRIMREQRRSNYLDNTLLPAEYTPWVGRSTDRFESMKIDMQQRSR